MLFSYDQAFPTFHSTLLLETQTVGHCARNKRCNGING